MKKFLLKSLFFIILGMILGKVIFLEKDILKLLKTKDKYYFLQEGVYTNNNIFENTTTNLKKSVMELKDDKIYVYTGITKDLDIAEQLVKIYKDKNINLSIKEKYISNEEFKNNVEQFDLLIKSSKQEEEILKIQEVVLANYEETIKNRENK